MLAGCKACRFSGLVVCSSCGSAWDYGDEDRPACGAELVEAFGFYLPVTVAAAVAVWLVLGPVAAGVVGAALYALAVFDLNKRSK